MANSEIPAGLQASLERADAITRIQIEAALQINSKYFDGEGLTYVPAILQALSSNLNATVMFAKP